MNVDFVVHSVIVQVLLRRLTAYQYNYDTYKNILISNTRDW
jgi:hypothetical protein